MVRREIRDGGEGVERGLRWKQDRDREFEEEDKEHRHLPLLVIPQGTMFLLSSRLDSAVKRCSKALQQ